MRARILLASLILCACAAPAASGQTPAQGVPAQRAPTRQADTPEVAAEPGGLAPGDMVRITVWRKPEISGEYLITSDGMIADPFYMEVSVTGLALPSLIEGIRAHVARFENGPRVLVEPLYRVAISGEVRQPDLYNLPPGTTVEQAVLVAGGVTERARADRVVLVRGEQEIELDLTRHADGPSRTAVRSADQIVVPRRSSIMRDYIAPASSVIAAAFSIVSVWIRLR